MELKKIRDLIRDLMPDEIIEVFWLDAAKISNTRGKITNKIYANYKRVVAQYHDLRTERLYGREYLILTSLESHPDNPTVYSIPLMCVVKLESLSERRTRFKEVSDVGRSFLTGKHTKIVESENGIGK